MFYFGLNIHSMRLSICVLNETGQVVNRSMVRGLVGQFGSGEPLVLNQPGDPLSCCVAVLGDHSTESASRAVVNQLVFLVGYRGSANHHPFSNAMAISLKRRSVRRSEPKSQRNRSRPVPPTSTSPAGAGSIRPVRKSRSQVTRRA